MKQSVRRTWQARGRSIYEKRENCYGKGPPFPGHIEIPLQRSTGHLAGQGPQDTQGMAKTPRKGHFFWNTSI
eukprot:1158893-Pelagomonas_calceolata.AAC.27